MAKVESFSNTTATYRRIEDLKDLLASIQDNGEMYIGEKAIVESQLEQLERALNRRPVAP